MRLKNLSLEELREIDISGLSQRQLDEFKVELLMRELGILTTRGKTVQVAMKPRPNRRKESVED